MRTHTNKLLGENELSMEHKAFDFDWDSFEAELLPILLPALKAKDSAKILSFIESNLNCISDPYEGERLTDNWRDELVSLPIQDIADYALPKYYSVTKEFGLGDSWIQISDELHQNEVDALLGKAFEIFDPGGYGSYFQSLEQIKQSIDILSKNENPVVKSYVKDLSEVSKGLYVTF